MDMDMDKHTHKDTYTIMDMGTDMYSGWKIFHVQYARKVRYKLDAVTDPYKPIIAWSTTVWTIFPGKSTSLSIFSFLQYHHVSRLRKSSMPYHTLLNSFLKWLMPIFAWEQFSNLYAIIFFKLYKMVSLWFNMGSIHENKFSGCNFYCPFHVKFYHSVIKNFTNMYYFQDLCPVTMIWICVLLNVTKYDPQHQYRYIFSCSKHCTYLKIIWFMCTSKSRTTFLGLRLCPVRLVYFALRTSNTDLYRNTN